MKPPPLTPAIFLLSWILIFPDSTGTAAEKAPVLVVPSAESTLHVAVPLPEGFKRNPDAQYGLVEVGLESKAFPIQFSIPAKERDPQDRARMLAIISPREGAPADRRFRLVRRTDSTPVESPFSLKEIDGKSVRVEENGRPRFTYNFEKITGEKVPARDRRRTRSGYVHPLWGVHGEVLTCDFPRDHYHHHGLFWAWPYVTVGDRLFDLWTSRGIRQDFVRWNRREAGPAAAVLDVANGWFVGEKCVMEERALLRAFAGDAKSQVLDVELTFVPQGEAIALRGAREKSYGGLALRGNVRWGKNQKKAAVSTPLGVATEDLVVTRLAWADLTYPFQEGSESGAAIFIPRDHPDYPPTWVARRSGLLAVGYPGVEGKTFPPGQPIRLNYRLWIHADAPSHDALRRAYADYLRGGRARWKN
ncbi:MAG: PmoA family protein [Pirellulales bacterium]|nr:PmoA family protein [Pirellulales bacterium]